jgi:hypothetical protein
MGHPIFMVIICLWYITPNDLNWHWRRSLTQRASRWPSYYSCQKM